MKQIHVNWTDYERALVIKGTIETYTRIIKDLF